MDLLTKCVFLISLLSCYLGKNGVEGVRKLSKEEDLEFEKQLKLINKPPIKTIQTSYGEIYDCIDFYKQPAFDHPLLKNHTFHHQMRPSSRPKVAEKKEVNMNGKYGRALKRTHASCPVGSVPIRRTTKEDLIRFKSHSERYNSNYNVLSADNPGTHYAVVRTKDDDKLSYYGGSAFLGIYNPSVQNSQYSSSRIKLQNGENILQAGWTVNPTLYGDNSTRIFIHFKTHTTGCFNIQCPGFVIVNKEIYIGASFTHISKRGGPQYDYQYIIYRDSKWTGNWWLALGGGDKTTPIGFWPGDILPDLTSNLATRIEWGGEVSSPPELPSPPMGSGGFIKKDADSDAICGAISTIDEDNNVVAATYTLEDGDMLSTYQVQKMASYVWYHQYDAHFGGPGGITGNS